MLMFNKKMIAHHKRGSSGSYGMSKTYESLDDPVDSNSKLSYNANETWESLGGYSNKQFN